MLKFKMTLKHVITSAINHKERAKHINCKLIKKMNIAYNSGGIQYNYLLFA